jgi:uncharacterized protein YdeI (YjbR/CyaY-like superfamily)
MASSRLDFLERVQIAGTAELRAWLEANHTRPDSVWLVHYKKCVADRYVPYGDIVDEALCFGWIDGLTRALDAERSMLLFSPRKPRSVWSRINKDRVMRLIASGRMMPPGLAKIEQAKKDGSWDLLTAADNLIMPDDLAKAFAKNKRAARGFDALTESARRRFLGNLALVKGPDARRRRIQAILDASLST